MTTPTVDMSQFKPLAPSAPSDGGGVDMGQFKPLQPSKGIAPGAMPGLSRPPMPQPAQDAITADLTAKASPTEGTYAMKSPTGATLQIPFSKVKSAAIPAGYTLATPDETARYAKDFHAAPVASWQDLLGDIEERPGWRHWLDPTTQVPEVAAGGVKGVATTAEGFRKLLGMQPKKPDMLNAIADRPNANANESAGELTENAGEFVSGEELLGLVGKAVKGGEALGDAGKISQILEKHPQIARILKVGMNAIKNVPELGQALLGAGQTFVKTGGDAQAAATSGVLAGATGGALRAGGALVAGGRTMLAGTGAEDAAAAAAREHAALENTAAANAAAGEGRAADRGAYAGVARQAAEPHLQAINESRVMPEQPVLMNQPSHDAPVKMNQPGGAPAVPVAGPRITTPAVPTGAKAKPTEIPQINIPETLATMHDFKGAADRLTDANMAGYDELDQATRGQFRQINAQTTAARRDVWKGVDGAGDVYRNAMGKMDALIDGSPRATPKMKDALKASWRASYVLHDLGDLWDRNLNGVPGASQASQAQRGIDGRGLLRDLQRAVKMHGRGVVEQTIGAGGLDTLEEIANNNLTATQRKAFNGAVTTVAQELDKLEPPPKRPEGMAPWGKRAAAMATGGAISHLAGGSPYYGMVAGEATYETTHAVMNALKANPKIAQNFLFALKSGATPERYGPMIASMISHAVSEDSRETQQKEQTK